MKSQIPKRGQDTKISQSGGPPKKVSDEAVHKELGDRMERAATTTSNLEVEHDSGNINRTQSMETLNEPILYGIGSGSGPRIRVDTARHKLNTASIKLVLPDIS
ncbi:hypothetical protein Tco_0256967 [Tanacetum coccineum]